VDYLVIIETEWTFSVHDFKSQLLERWPMVRTRDVQSTKHTAVLDFEVPMMQSVIYGELYQKGNAVSFSGELQDCADFAHWCRSLIPAGESVLFCDEAMNTNLSLKMDTTPADIFQAVVTSYGGS
jgi:hypothetical protein